MFLDDLKVTLDDFRLFQGVTGLKHRGCMGCSWGFNAIFIGII